MDGGAHPTCSAPAPSLKDRLLRWRDARLGDPRFQAWAARFPLTRRIARRNAQKLFDLTAGFVYSQTLAACVSLDLFEMLAAGPLGTDEIAARTGLSPERAERLLAAATALDLLARTGDRWRLAEMGAAIRGAPGVVEMIRHHAMLYADLADPVALLRGQAGPTQLGAFWGYAGGARTRALERADTEAYSRLMAASQAMVAAEVLAAYDFSRHRHLMDVGGGAGAFLSAVAQRHPGLSLSLFDLKPVADSARTRLADRGITAETHGGDFFADSLPQGADAISLVRILHDHDDQPVRRLLASVHAALPPSGTVVIAEPLSGPGEGRVGDAYFGFYMMAMGSGRPRSFAEIEALLKHAGFESVRRHGRGAFLAQTITATRS